MYELIFQDHVAAQIGEQGDTPYSPMANFSLKILGEGFGIQGDQGQGAGVVALAGIQHPGDSADITREWLEQNFASIGQRSTVDLRVEFLDLGAEHQG
ncbi:MAG: hypothetical protein V2I32_12335 [Desulforhopalus sp.]|nr:hypothetical protein [Desulforhopalus sp.]